MSIHLERALFVVAPQDSGKSTTLRSMFKDRRLGTGGNTPSSSEQRRLPEVYWIGNERRLYLRPTSPHEYGESSFEFIEKTRSKMIEGRWCFAGPLQPDASRRMPDVVASVSEFCDAFSPERVRVAFLSPNRHGIQIDAFLPNRDLTAELLAIPKVEALCVDGRRRGANGLLLADFFDFA